MKHEPRITTYEKHITKHVLLSSTLVAVLLLVSVIAIAQVDADTPDEVLLKGINKDKMFKVIKPSTRLTLRVDGVETPVRVTYSGSKAVLDPTGLSEADKQRVREAYVLISGNDEVVFESKKRNQ